MSHFLVYHTFSRATEQGRAAGALYIGTAVAISVSLLDKIGEP